MEEAEGNLEENHRAIDVYRKLGMTVTDYRVCEEEWPT